MSKIKPLIYPLMIILITASGIFLTLSYLDLISLSSEQDIVEYNNEFTQDRNGIVSSVEAINKIINSTGAEEDIRSEIELLDQSINDYKEHLDSEKLPSEADKLKNELENFASFSEEYSSKVLEYADNLKAEERKISELIEEYNLALSKINEQNVKIAETLNDLVGYEAIKKEDIENLVAN